MRTLHASAPTWRLPSLVLPRVSRQLALAAATGFLEVAARNVVGPLPFMLCALVYRRVVLKRGG